MILFLLVIYLGVIVILYINLYYRFGGLRQPVPPRRCFLIKWLTKTAWRSCLFSFSHPCVFVLSSALSVIFIFFICHLFSQDRLSSFFISVHFQREAIIFSHGFKSCRLYHSKFTKAFFLRIHCIMRLWQMLEL